jgi:hypothetical protein
VFLFVGISGLEVEKIEEKGSRSEGNQVWRDRVEGKENLGHDLGEQSREEKMKREEKYRDS